MAQQLIDIGTTPNDGTGDKPRPAAIKINENFTELYAAIGGGYVESVTGDGVDNSDPANPVLSFPTPGDIGADISGAAAAVSSNLSDHISDTTDAHAASAIGNTPAGTISATTVQAAINELDSEKQASLGFTPENVANKATDFLTIDNTKYPTTQAVNNEIIARLAGLAWKAPVTCATTANITLSGEQTIDGVATSAMRVLVKNQSTASQNGIYISAAGAWARSSDADTGTEIHGAVTTVQEGTTNANTTWVQTSDGVTIGVTSIVWSQLGTSVPDANSTTKGIARLYSSTSLGTNTDGAPDQNSVKIYVDAVSTTVAGLVIDSIADADATHAPSRNAVFDALALKVAKSGDTMGGDLAMGSNKVTGLGAASANGDAVRYEQVTPAVTAAIAAVAPTQAYQYAISDEITPITAGTSKITFRMPFAFTLTGVRASLVTAQASGSIFTIDINESGTTILSTKLTIDNTEKTSTTAATPVVISDANLADDAEITIDVDQVGNGTATGCKVTLIGHL